MSIDWPGTLAAVEAALAADGVGRARPPAALPPDVELAARCAVAAKFLAVGTPRTFAAVQLGARTELFVAAQAAWAPAREIRTWSPGDPPAALDAALAADIVVAAGPLAVPRAAVRGGTHLAALDARVVLAPDLLAAAEVYDVRRLAAVVAGLVDGRRLDEITVLVCEG
jgi:hypothetical protein